MPPSVKKMSSNNFQINYCMSVGETSTEEKWQTGGAYMQRCSDTCISKLQSSR